MNCINLGDPFDSCTAVQTTFLFGTGVPIFFFSVRTPGSTRFLAYVPGKQSH